MKMSYFIIHTPKIFQSWLLLFKRPKSIGNQNTVVLQTYFQFLCHLDVVESQFENYGKIIKEQAPNNTCQNLGVCKINRSEKRSGLLDRNFLRCFRNNSRIGIFGKKILLRTF